MVLTKSDTILMRWARKTEDPMILDFIQDIAIRHGSLMLERIAVRRKVELKEKESE